MVTMEPLISLYQYLCYSSHQFSISFLCELIIQTLLILLLFTFLRSQHIIHLPVHHCNNMLNPALHLILVLKVDKAQHCYVKKLFT